MTNLELAEKFLLTSRLEKNLSLRTLKAYHCDLTAFVQLIGSKSITTLSIDDLRNYLFDLEKQKLADTSIKRKLATLKVFFSFLEDEGLVDISPARKLKKKYRTARRLPRVMSSDEIEKLLKAAYKSTKNATRKRSFEYFKRIRDRAILELLYATGIRIDELVKINIFDLDLSAKTLFIFGKGRKERLLYVSSPEVIDILKEYIAYRNNYSPDTEALFLNKFGNRLGVYFIRNIFKEYWTLAGNERKFTPHCLRHTMATMLMENGADVRSVQEILGHSSISTTEIYLTVSKRRKEEVLSRYNHRNILQIVN